MSTLESSVPPGRRVDPSEKRKQPREQTLRAVTLRLTDASLLAVGRNLSASGAYVVTGDEIPVEVLLESTSGETCVPARLVRIDPITHGTLGIALRFVRDLTPEELGE